ncbi:hypothetical protein [Amycolatopsis sp.]|uniref:hypothetical protein n=1 Tax=Amycolatopsis sp. TaxID=37632 RepID=UPI002D7F37E9|nr:hypothetical protein [Amycolatopsis sp.]
MHSAKDRWNALVGGVFKRPTRLLTVVVLVGILYLIGTFIPWINPAVFALVATVLLVSPVMNRWMIEYAKQQNHRRNSSSS